MLVVVLREERESGGCSFTENAIVKSLEEREREGEWKFEKFGGCIDVVVVLGGGREEREKILGEDPRTICLTGI